jgi:adenylate cyclase
LFSSIDCLKKESAQSGSRIKQGYLPIEKGLELAQRACMSIDFSPVEARIRRKDGVFYLTLKGSGTLARDELETKIPAHLFGQYWPLTEGRQVEKLRLTKTILDCVVEFDVYTDRELILAEIELRAEQETAKMPNLGKDVTNDPGYKNRNLAR